MALEIRVGPEVRVKDLQDARLQGFEKKGRRGTTGYLILTGAMLSYGPPVASDSGAPVPSAS